MNAAQTAWAVLTGVLGLIGLGCLMVDTEASRLAAGGLVGACLLGYVALTAMIVIDRSA